MNKTHLNQPGFWKRRKKFLPHSFSIISPPLTSARVHTVSRRPPSSLPGGENSQSLLPARLSCLSSLCLQFHNCWLSWSHRQWAPDARYQHQPESSSESQWLVKLRPLRLCYGHAPPVPPLGLQIYCQRSTPLCSALLPGCYIVNLHFHLCLISTWIQFHFASSLCYNAPCSALLRAGEREGKKEQTINKRWRRSMREWCKFRHWQPDVATFTKMTKKQTKKKLLSKFSRKKFHPVSLPT